MARNTKLANFDDQYPERTSFPEIEEPTGILSQSLIIEAGSIENWVQITEVQSKERTRRHLVYWIMGLYTVCVLAGLIAFIATRDLRYLAILAIPGVGLLALPLRIMLTYYF